MPAAPDTSSHAAFEALRDQALGCTRCRLAEGRTQVVFGTGDPDADLMFVGEGPGAQEDLQGLPFVGRSGQLLDRLLLEEMGLTRESCYIANVVKCRPPDNRDPKPDEIAACRPWLEAQIDLIAPKVIVTLGNFSSKLLLDTKDGITKLRGSVYDYRDRPDGGTVRLVPTFHPAAVLRGGGEPMAKMRADLVRAKQALAAAGAPGTGGAS
ncbi:uracil-DNA glycosylase [Dermatobacter hominis]|uniref:uracil-DNA glycosylase n=1 Tax=Dermatobacter hominis TaxID=2884263 RepID=UPI001D117AB9|nr:uracil-DNA glycosylase [Dermatobacter hominis]UDY38018.1 uracil-DNA glycosylase [Dermatobacter hominis]